MRNQNPIRKSARAKIRYRLGRFLKSVHSQIDAATGLKLPTPANPPKCPTFKASNQNNNDKNVPNTDVTVIVSLSRMDKEK